jgi:hypothetical protein
MQLDFKHAQKELNFQDAQKILPTELEKETFVDSLPSIIKDRYILFSHCH